MKVKTILSKAKSAKTEVDSNVLLCLLEDAFTKTRSLKNLYNWNHESYVEEDGAFIKFEMNRLSLPMAKARGF